MFRWTRRGAGEGTRIAAGAVLEGSLRSDGGITVDGRVHGAVESATSVRVGPGGTIEGDVRGDEVTVGGRVQGTVLAAGRLHMLATGTIHGDARYGSLEVDRGGQIEGRTTPIAGLEAPTTLEPPMLSDEALIELPAHVSQVSPVSHVSPALPAPPASAGEAAQLAPSPAAELGEPAAASAPRDSTPPPLPTAPSASTRPRPLPPLRPTERARLAARETHPPELPATDGAAAPIPPA